ncbi:calcium:proton antiporter [Sanguibacter sp. HDW7]|uniref:calcium:proton antiporter n=1 Tax=Sanguibacter sp. HDW7 TaxID=2714931 RepID=UPI00140BE867|nr:calcium:proton antiporter [Sanguibacter sp. HDW7]QIK82590.1 calcium:proton antiporter [Sanguibacter sp. HDW7]
MTTTSAPLVTRADIVRAGLGWVAYAVLLAVGGILEPPLPGPLLVAALVVIVGVVVVCAFGVVTQAEALAHRLGDPYGTLVLTLSIVIIEVVLIAAVMLGPGEHASIARDSVMAVSMIILNLVVGASLLVGGLRRGSLGHNRAGVSTYLALLVVLLALAFALPAYVGSEGSYSVVQAVPVVVLTVGLYAFFLQQQTGPRADDFREVDADVSPAAGEAPAPAPREPFARTLREHRREILTRLGLLVATVLPIVLLSHDMASLLDDGLGRLGAPVALAGVLIALIVFLPESLTSVRAALAGEGQRVSNLCHGALVSTVGLTIPVVLVIGMLTGQRVLLAESPANLVLLATTLLLSVATFSGRRATAVHGAVHLVLFGIYVLALLS